jgi:hypothetical protein
MIKRTRAVACLAVVLAAFFLAPRSLSAQVGDEWLGTWKESVEKSTYRPGPAPKTASVAKWERAGEKQVRITVDLVDEKGAPAHWVVVTELDGKDTPITGAPAGMTRAVKRIDDRTCEFVTKMNGKELTTTRVIVSPSGQTRRFVTTGTNAQGQAVNEIVIWDKQ